MCAAVGQARLMAHYEDLFGAEKITIGQVLLTHADFQHRIRFANAKRTMEHMIRHNVIPIINENDVVADEEIKADLSLGDNDYLAALVVKLVRADLLIILSTVDGVLDASGKRVPCIENLSEAFALVNPAQAGGLSKGGMDSKLRAAQIAIKAGCGVVIACGRDSKVLLNVMAGKDTGTLLLSSAL
jgi:glutamate 5-kinase